MPVERHDDDDDDDDTCSCIVAIQHTNPSPTQKKQTYQFFLQCEIQSEKTVHIPTDIFLVIPSLFSDIVSHFGVIPEFKLQQKALSFFFRWRC